MEGGNTFPGGGDSSPYYTQNLKQFTILELEAATSIFSQHNIIGEGGFGLVYKGLLQDGSIVAIKRHLHNRTPYFVHEVKVNILLEIGLIFLFWFFGHIDNFVKLTVIKSILIVFSKIHVFFFWEFFAL